MPAFMRSAKPTVAATPTPSAAAATATTSKLNNKSTDVPTESTSTAASFTQQSLHVLHQFLSYADPESASLLPIPTNHATSSPSSSIPSAEPEIPIPEWNVLYTSTTPPTAPGGFASSITVRSHPDPNRYLFSVQSTLPGVTARQFWSLMASAENRKLWDTTVEEGAVKRWLATEPRAAKTDDSAKSADLARAMAARVELLRFGSIFMVAKARDMVLLSVDARLPSKSSGAGEQGPLRLVSTSQSVVDPSLPPRKGYTRFELKTGGFMVEDLGDDGVPDAAASAAELAKSPSSATSAKGSHFRLGLLGLGRHARSNSSSSSSSRQLNVDPATVAAPRRDPRGPAVLITQVSDLGEMAAWVPASVIKMVASTLVPRSIASVAKVAKTMLVSPSLYQDFDSRQKTANVGEKAIAEPLGQVGGTWYRHRTLPAMVGQGFLSKPRSSTSIAAVDVPKKTDVVGSPPPRLSDVPELAATPSKTTAKAESIISPKLVGDKILQPTSKEVAMSTPTPTPALALAPASVPAHVSSPLPPRTSSLPGSPHKPLSPFTNRPAMLLDLRSLSPPSFPDRLLARGSPLPASPGMATTTDSELGQDDAMSSSLNSLASSSPAANRLRKRLPVAMTPSEGTETVPGSVAASDLDEFGPSKGDYLSKGNVYGLAASQFKRATLHLAAGEGEEVEVMDEADVTMTVRDWAMRAGLAAEKRSRLLSNGCFEGYMDSEMRRAVNGSGGSGSSGSRKTEAIGGDKATTAVAVPGLEKRMRRLSSALYAEMERRQRSDGGFSPSSFKSAKQPLPQIELASSDDGKASAPTESSELVAPLADALAESMPFLTQSDQARVKEQARRVSAMVLVGSDALALSLAPGARDSLGLQLDGLSTPTSEVSTPATSEWDALSAVDEVSPNQQQQQQGKKGKERSPLGNGMRCRKVSVNSSGRSISISRARAEVRANTESVISIENPSSSSPSSAFSTATATAIEQQQGRAVSTLRELDRNASARRTITSAPTASTKVPTSSGYGARLISGLAYYSGYANSDPIPTGQQRLSIPTAHSLGRKRTRANYRLENNSKLHPFPGYKTPKPNAASEELPPPITGFGVGRMRRYAVPEEAPGAGEDESWEDEPPTAL